MKTKHLFKIVLILLFIVVLMTTAWVQASSKKMITQKPVMKMTIPIPENITTPNKVKTSIGTLNFFDGVPIGNTKEMVYDFVDRGRAVEVFINMTPAVSMYALRQGHRDLGLPDCNQILIAEQLGDSKPLVLTWNNTSLYTWGFLDLKKDGPTVIELPPDVLGILATCISATFPIWVRPVRTVVKGASIWSCLRATRKMCRTVTTF